MPAQGVELLLVLPCLDGAEALEACLRKAQDALRDRRAGLRLTRIGED